MGILDTVDDVIDKTVVLSFTSIGYRLRRRRWADTETSLAGRTVVITGATSGLGRSAAGQVAGLGARVVLVGRNAGKAEQARTEIAAATGNTDIDIQLADLSLMAQIRALAARLLEAERSIDVLVNNAGVLFNERRVTSEGVEMSLATNLLGHFLLTDLLVPRLVESAPARVINVSSGGMYTQRIRVDDLQFENEPYNGSVAYARTKRGQIILTELWAERLAGRGVVVHAMHPGWADTPGVETSLPTFRKLAGPLLRTAQQGADTITWLAASPEAGESTGGFWLDRKRRPTHRLRSTRETADERTRLWDALSELSGSTPTG